MSRLGSHTHAQKDSGLSGVASLAQRRRGGPDTCRAACSQPTDEHESLLHNLKVTPHFCAGMLSVVHGEQGTLGWGKTRRDGEGKKFIQRAVVVFLIPASPSGKTCALLLLTWFELTIWQVRVSNVNHSWFFSFFFFYKLTLFFLYICCFLKCRSI